MTSARARGRSLELREAEAWKATGWKVEARHPVKFVGPGRTAACDFFDRYDLIAASSGVVVFIQVSTESPNSHESPLGLMAAEPDFDADELRLCSERGLGVFEVYSYWRRLKGQGWIADRRWWIT